jgi:hypothetical protein
MLNLHELADTLTESPVTLAEIADADGPRQCVACLWCGRTFRPRATGGSTQRFCSTEHRKAFWTAARRWTMRAIETGLLSVDCLKANQSSVYAAGEAFPTGRKSRSAPENLCRGNSRLVDRTATV